MKLCVTSLLLLLTSSAVVHARSTNSTSTRFNTLGTQWPDCPDGWTKFKRKCYALGLPVPGDSLSEACQPYENASPASIHSKQVNSFLLGLLEGEDAWLGFRKFPPFERLEWMDGSSYNFYYWSNGDSYPTPTPLGTCSYLNSRNAGKWQDGDCSLLKRPICRMNLPACPRGWHEFRGFCYFYAPDNISCADVWSFCQAAAPPTTSGPQRAGAGPVSIHSQRQNDFLRGLLNPEWYFPWIGLTRSSETADWEWADRTAVDYTKWRDNEPAGEDRCAVLTQDSAGPNPGTWLGSVSENAVQSVLCQIKLEL